MSHPPRDEPHTSLSWSTRLPYPVFRWGLSVARGFPLGCLTRGLVIKGRCGSARRMHLTIDHYIWTLSCNGAPDMDSRVATPCNVHVVVGVYHRFPSPALDWVWGSAEVAASPAHPAASAFSIALSTCTRRIGTSRRSLSPSSRASRRRPRCILCDMDHYAALTCPAGLLDVQHPVRAAARTTSPP